MPPEVKKVNVHRSMYTSEIQHKDSTAETDLLYPLTSFTFILYFQKCFSSFFYIIFLSVLQKS